MTHDENRISDLIDGGLHEKSAIDKAKYELHMRHIAAIDEAATKSWEDDAKYNPTPNNPYAYVYGFKAGAQTILDNPGEWGLYSLDALKIEMDKSTSRRHRKIESDNQHLQSQLAKYREALERIIVEAEDNEQVDWRYIAENMVQIAEEALKQQ